ncbi:bacteriocin immunity protein [Lactiplantibacillus carotarum]|uniref:bacteriocin immunity protein n=1 Tax=Lactiplantibacillus carotarum TaxID=2993456 RepID=UPI00298F23AE|nr:bacteriocin immunity protein [Lactiplantibacillus carotarum]
MTSRDWWYSTGEQRRQTAMAKILDLVGDLSPTTEQPLRELLARYYQELLAQTSGSPVYVLMRLDLDIATCLHQNGIVLSPANSKRIHDLIKLTPGYIK